MYADVDVLPMALAVACLQRGQHAHHGEHATAQVPDGDAGAGRVVGIVTGDRHAATDSLHHLVERWALVVGAVLAEA